MVQTTFYSLNQELPFHSCQLHQNGQHEFHHWRPVSVIFNHFKSKDLFTYHEPYVFSNINMTPLTASYGNNYALESVSIDGEGRILQHRSGDSVFYSYDYYLKDHLGSTRMVINDENSITEKIAYQSYGTISLLDSSSPALPSREKFTGKEFDTRGQISHGWSLILR